MKDRVREAVFNLLGPTVRGKHALDLFAGTGALAWEALAQGAVRATLVEQHHPTAAALRRTAAELGVEAETTVAGGRRLPLVSPRSGFGRRPHGSSSVRRRTTSTSTRREDMLALISGLIAAAPMESLFVVESNARFDLALLPHPAAWDVRRYPPAVVAISEEVKAKIGRSSLLLHPFCNTSAACAQRRASAAVGASAIARTIGSVLLPRTNSQRPGQSSRSPSSRSAAASAKCRSRASRAAGIFSCASEIFVFTIS